MSTRVNTIIKPRVFKHNALRRKEAIAFYLTISPWLVGFLFLILGPMIASMYFSLTNWDMLSPPQYVGFQNYTKLFSQDPLFWQSLKVTVIYTVASVPIGLALSLFVAILMNQKVRGMRIFRTIFYIPSVVSGVAVSVMWMWVFNPDFGLINTFLSWFGIKGPGWIADPRWALTSLIIMSLWGFGGAALIFWAGLTSVPTSLYEAAEIDGANAWKKFLRITLPMLSPTILFNLVMGVIGSFQTFTQAYVMTNGGPQYSTLFYYYYLYQQAFSQFDMGYASALAWVLFLIILICTLLVFKWSNFWVFYGGEQK